MAFDLLTYCFQSGSCSLISARVGAFMGKIMGNSRVRTGMRGPTRGPKRSEPRRRQRASPAGRFPSRQSTVSEQTRRPSQSPRARSNLALRRPPARSFTSSRRAVPIPPRGFSHSRHPARISVKCRMAAAAATAAPSWDTSRSIRCSSPSSAAPAASSLCRRRRSSCNQPRKSPATDTVHRMVSVVLRFGWSELKPHRSLKPALCCVRSAP